VAVDPADLEAFACLSEAELHTIAYPGGDVSHRFAMLLRGRRWSRPRSTLSASAAPTCAPGTPGLA
jgi:hypothetical protein